jgi:hypothetical protein
MVDSGGWMEWMVVGWNGGWWNLVLEEVDGGWMDGGGGGTWMEVGWRRNPGWMEDGGWWMEVDGGGGTTKTVTSKWWCGEVEVADATNNTRSWLQIKLSAASRTSACGALWRRGSAVVSYCAGFTLPAQLSRHHRAPWWLKQRTQFCSPRSEEGTL